MGAKTDTSDIELWFEETPVRKGRVKPYQGKVVNADMPPPMELKQPQNGLEGISSLRLVRELIVRHYKVALIALFSALVGAFVSVGTK